MRELLRSQCEHDLCISMSAWVGSSTFMQHVATFLNRPADAAPIADSWFTPDGNRELAEDSTHYVELLEQSTKFMRHGCRWYLDVDNDNDSTAPLHACEIQVCGYASDM